MTEITDGVDTITPHTVTGYEADAEVRHVVHQIIGRDEDDISLVPASLRVGALECLCVSKADAWALHALLVEPGTFALTDDDHDELAMSFVVDGRVRITLEDETRALWLVEFGFREVTA